MLYHYLVTEHHVVIMEDEVIPHAFEAHCTAGDWHLLCPYGKEQALEAAEGHLREKGRARPRPTDIAAHRSQPNWRQGQQLGHRFGKYEDKPPLAGR